MNVFQSMIIMFSLYTRIPMPMVSWTPEKMKPVLLWLPLSGLAVGAFEALWIWICAWFQMHPALYAAGACAIIAGVTGGIHLDGLADTEDARASHADPERKRRILKDPHTGAFGVVSIVLYELLSFGLYSEIYTSGKTAAGIMISLLVIPVMARALTQLAIAELPPAEEGGMLYRFSSLTDTALLKSSAALFLLLGVCALWVAQGMLLVFEAAAAFLMYLRFRPMVMQEFGGISGDLCGWQIQMTELFLLLSMMLATKVPL